MDRCSDTTADHLLPPPSPYPATVEPSPVESNGTTNTDHTEVPWREHHDDVANWRG